MRRANVDRMILLAIVWIQPGAAQNPYPSVSEIIKQYDRDKDGRLSGEEVARGTYARQFRRWDVDRDDVVSAADIVRFRRRFGIAADGSRIADDSRTQRKRSLDLPNIGELPRVDRDHRPPPQAARQSAFILKTEVHPTVGDQYIVLTDHHDEAHLKPLRRLAAHRDGALIEVEDLAALPSLPERRNELREQLSDAKYVAIAMRKDSYRENTLLGLWELLSRIDADPQIDVWPGLLVASDAESLSQLVEQSIAFKPLAEERFKPIAISQVQRVTETRSLQKAGILRHHFRQMEIETPVVAIYGQQASAAPQLKGSRVWNLTAPAKPSFVRDFPADVEAALDDASIWILHGHGIPGMSCSVDVDALADNVRGKILLTGSCFSASPWTSDLPALREAPGGYRVDRRDAFAIRAIDQGAIVAFGHQRLSSGFPHLYPVLESWTKGQSVGQAYQQLLNGLIAFQQVESGEFMITEADKQSNRLRQNSLLYVVIGDPALTPIKAMH